MPMKNLAEPIAGDSNTVMSGRAMTSPRVTKERWIACQLCDPDKFGACRGADAIPRGVVKIAGSRLCARHTEILMAIASASGVPASEYLPIGAQSHSQQHEQAA